MCNCKEEMEKKLLEKFKKAPGEEHKIEITGYGFMIDKDNNLTFRPVMPIEHTWLHTFKNGNQKRKKETIIFALSNCPFCGEKVDHHNSGTCDGGKEN